MRCTCGHDEHYNFAIDNGLCNMCIGERLEFLEFAEKLCPTTMDIAMQQFKLRQEQLKD